MTAEMIPDVKKTDCCGCQACMNACPVSCIEMKSDEEFFLYPHIDSEKCVHCHACERVCPALNKNLPENTENKKVYACWNPDMDKRINSTSGGVVSVLSEKIISEGGCVVGAYYRDDFTVAHMIGATEQEILKLRQSKYMQSDMGLIYKAVGELLKEGKKVLFCGTPCHNAALRNYLRVVPDNLFQCDFICRGVISPGVFKEYLSYLEKKYKGKAVKVQFKNKDYGWNRFSTKVWFDNGAEYIRDRYHDPYMVSYLRYSVSLRPSCYECKYKGTERFSDVTVGDFWGIAKKDSTLDDDHGTSLVMINTEKGQKMFDSVRDGLKYTECSIDDIPGGNMCLSKSPKIGERRDLFFKDLGKKSFGYIYKRYVLQRKVSTVLKKFGLNSHK